MTVAKLEDLIQSCETGTWGGEVDDGANGNPVLRSSNIQDSRLDLSEYAVRSIPAKDQGKKKLLTGDIIITASSGSPELIGKCARFVQPTDGTDYYYSNFTLRVRADEKKLDSKYLYYFLISDQARSYLRGANDTTSGLRNLNKKIYLRQPVPLRPLEEQRRIAEVLDRADALRQKRRLALQKLDTLLQSVFLDMFGDPKANPRDWPAVTFDEIVQDTKLGLVRSSAQFGTDFTVPYVRMNAINRTGEFDVSTVLRTDATEKEIRESGLERGDFLFNTRNSRELVGKTAIFDENGTFLFNNNILRVRFTQDVDPWYVHRYFQSDRAKNDLEMRKSGTTNVFAVYYKSLATMPILLPPYGLQARYGDVARKIAAMKRLWSHTESATERLFSALQAELFLGNHAH